MLRPFFAPISNFWYALLNLLYPQTCLLCNYKLGDGQRPGLICETCWSKIRINATVCSIEGDCEGFAFDRVFYATTYDETMKRCIRLFKYEGKVQMVNLLGEIMADFADKNINSHEIDLIVPMPLHPVKLRERQFNQSEALATYLAKKLNKKIIKDRIKRIKYTLPQTELKREDRLKNVKDAFLAKRHNGFEDRTILLIDDVFTTGATLHECAKSLKNAGAKKVIAFALARGN